MEPKFLLINVNDIVIPENYVPVKHKRHTCDAIRITGVMVPVIVYEENGKYFLKDGYERLMCAREAGMGTVPALVVDKSEPLISFALNYVRGSYCGIDILMFVYEFAQKYDMKTLEKVLGRSWETIRKYVRIMNQILALNLSKDEFKELKDKCVNVKKLIACTESSDNKEQFLNCVRGEIRRKKSVTPEAIRKAVNLEKDQNYKTATDIVDTYGAEKIINLIQLMDIFKNEVCPKLNEMKTCLDGISFNILSNICSHVS